MMISTRRNLLRRGAALAATGALAGSGLLTPTQARAPGASAMPWPDVGPAFARLHKRFLLAPCSNGNIALMANVARRNNIPWDAILGSEIAQGYKPQPKVYLMTCEAFNLKPEQVMMCAAHSGDLSSAQKLGMRTGHVGRPGEGGPGTGETEPKGQFDVVGKNFHDFADKLGV